ncbi:unnamed protein product [Aphanomyces euteiches]
MGGPTYQSLASNPPVVSQEHPLISASGISKLFFSWATPILSLGNNRQLDPSDLWPLEAENECRVVSEVFEPTFQRSRSIFWTIAVTFWWRFAFVGLLQIGNVLGTLYGPIVLKQILTAMEANTFDLQYILKLIVSLFAVRVVSALLSAHSNLQAQLIAVKITSALQHLLFQKSLHLDAKFRREKTAGEISNMFSNDIQWIINFAIFANQLWIVPFQVVLTLIMLYNVIGWATFVGAAVIVINLMMNQVIVVAIRNGFEELMKHKDNRMKTINEVFGAMQIIKLNAWEEKFAEKIAVERKTELDSLWRIFVRFTISIVVLYLGPALVTIASFATYTLIMREPLPASKLFTALSLFTLLKYPMLTLPNIIASLLQALVALKRFMEFFDMDDRDPTQVATPKTVDAETLKDLVAQNIDIQVQDATFGWDATKPLFDKVNLTVKRGEFVVIHGSVGEGKTSLCSAFLGEMEKYSGSVFIGGQVAYFSQQAWIQNTTVRENILFGKPYDRVKYNRVIEACALTKDMTLFSAGDRTELGQKGVNLSGGQKARISLARACYSDADIFILDSPLSAVDAIVQNEIFTKCFLGLLRNKTVVLVTHSPEIVASKYIDRLIEIKDGKLIETVVASERESHPILVQPLVARRGYTAQTDDDTDSLDDHPSHAIGDHAMLVSPSVTTPLPLNYDGFSFTPLDPSSRQTYEEPVSGMLVLDEERSSGRVSSEVFQGYLNASGGWLAFWYLIFVLAIWQVLMVSSDLWLSYWSSTATQVTQQEFLDQSGYYLGIYTLVSLAGVFSTVLRSLAVYESGIKASRILFDQMTQALLRAPMKFFDTNPIGRILNRYSNDMNTIDTQIPLTISGVSSAFFLAVCTLGTTIYMTGIVGFFLLPLMYLYIMIGKFYVQPAREMERVNKTTKSPLLNLISEAIEGMLVIRAFGDKQVRRFQRIHYRNVDANNEAFVAAQVISQWFSLRIQLTSALLVFTISLALVFMRDYLTPGFIGLSLNYLFSSLGFFEYIISAWSQLETSMIGPERVTEYAQVEPEAPRVISGAVAKTWPTKGDIQFENMGFRYKENDPLILKEVNVHIQSGEKIGIVGRTGAGKSSLTMALFRINELAAGAIKIDGVDISQVGVKTLRSAIAIIPQTPVLFKGTLRNYLDPFGEYTEDDLSSCLQKVRLVDRISNVDGKLDSPVEENGENFSVGERQMLCMARALLRQARIVVMDEATAAIDHETDQNLQRVIRTEFASSTVLTIAHRLDTVLDCDRILVFDQGRLAQCDAPKALIGQGGGIFFELCSEGGYLDKIIE